jgi:hypothetical protein
MDEVRGEGGHKDGRDGREEAGGGGGGFILAVTVPP